MLRVVQDLRRMRESAQEIAAARIDTVPVGVAIIYEDFAAGMAAKQFSDRLESELGPGFSVRCDVWSYDVLREPKSRLLAAADSAVADIIIIAARRTESKLPWYMGDWIKSWLPLKQGNSSALIALIEGEPEVDGKPAALRSALRAIAKDGGMDFFCQAWKCALSSVWPSLEENSLEPQAVGMGS